MIIYLRMLFKNFLLIEYIRFIVTIVYMYFNILYKQSFMKLKLNIC